MSVITVGIESNDWAVYLLPAIYLLLAGTVARVGWLYYKQFKKHRKSANVAGLSYFLWAVAFDAMYSFISIYYMFIKSILAPNHVAVVQLSIMILPNFVVLLAALYFYFTSIEVAE